MQGDKLAVHFVMQFTQSPQLPAALNSAQELRTGDGVWVEVAAAVVWDHQAVE